MSKQASKEIVVLSEKTHIRTRPQMYVGSVKPTEEKIPVIKNSKIFIEEKSVSIGMYKILNEAIDNAVDEAKRMKGKMESITIKVNSETNSISVKDSGNGFFNGASINKATGKTNIETAFSQLRSGSNFSNDDIDESLIGTNGYGIKTLNVLSERFKVITVNDTHYFEKEWIDFESDDSKTILRKKKPSDKKGTYIEAEPLKEVFGDSKWDLDVLQASLTFKQRLIKKDPILKTLKLNFFWDNQSISLSDEFFPKECFSLETPIGEVVIWEKYEGSGSVSFINSAMCTGIHQKIINEYINAKLEDSLGHHFYDSFVSLNLPPKVVKFGDQNKTRFVSPREEVFSYIDLEIGKRIVSFFRTQIFLSIQKKVDDRRNEGEYKKLKAQRKKIDVKFSHKYFPSASKKPETLFIVEGLSASGSILQKRQPQKEAVYALKGKIKNARSLGDLSSNKEILELMQILNLDPDNSKLECPFQKIVIATDADCLSGETFIPTSKGIKKAEDINPGDEILTPAGYTAVLRVQAQNFDEIFEIETEKIKITCSPDHKFPVFRDQKMQIIEAKEILKSDKLISEKEAKIPVHSVKSILSRSDQKYYDLEIAGDHVFFICDQKGENLILTHNCDGYHIRSLLINLFNSWFPWLVEQGKIYILETPIVTVGDRVKKYFYSMEDFLSYKGQKTHVRYLKGLGSLAISDWEHVMADKSLNRLQKDPQTNKNLEMAFGKLSSLRKDWLSAKS